LAKADNGMTSLHIREAGSGPPIVLLHGWSCHGGFFDNQIAALSDSFHVLAPDLPGHGASAREGEPTIEAAAEAVGDLLAARALSDVTLVGWSMGAHVAYSLLQHDASRIGRLVVVDMTPKVLNNADWYLGIRSGLDAARSARAVAAMRADWPRYVPHVVDNMFATGGGEAWRDYASAEIAKNDPALMAIAWQSLTAQDFRAFLPQIAVPALIAYGALSRIYVEDVARYQSGAIPDARIVRFEASGHSPHLEEPQRFAATLRDFCRHP
jgi:pimeloyl-ACP methyl ester carboxylesterase